MIIAPIQASPIHESQILLNDEGLVLACRQGEEAAWNVLVDRYQRLIYAIPRRAGLDEERSAEVFQHTFAKMLEHLNRIKRPGCIHAWLVTTARHETLRQIRLQNAEQSISDTHDPESESQFEVLTDEAPLPAEMVEQLEEQHLIRQALEAMDGRCRELLTLLFYRPNPPSYAEVAAALDIPEGSLGPTRSRCLQKLRCLLENSGI